MTVADVEGWIDARSTTTLQQSPSATAYGQQRELLRAYNPCTATELPEVDHRTARQIRFFTEREWAVFRAALKDDVVLLCDYLLATGLRMVGPLPRRPRPDRPGGRRGEGVADCCQLRTPGSPICLVASPAGRVTDLHQQSILFDRGLAAVG
jgi:hypothetical protein